METQEFIIEDKNYLKGKENDMEYLPNTVLVLESVAKFCLEHPYVSLFLVCLVIMVGKSK